MYLSDFGLFAGFIALAAVVIVALYAILGIGCNRTAEALELEAHWGFWEGCIVEYEGEMYQLDELRRLR